MKCHCCSGKEAINCCAPFLTGEKFPATPEELMRSRYSAYSQVDIAYIGKTMLPPASDGFDPAGARKWATRIQWQKLEVIGTKVEGDIGYVEFKAYFIDKKKAHVMHELSEFQRVDGKWYYVDGKHL